MKNLSSVTGEYFKRVHLWSGVTRKWLFYLGRRDQCLFCSYCR